MDLSKVWFILLLVVMAATITSEILVDAKEDNAPDFHFPKRKEPFFLGTRRFLAQSSRATAMTCDKYPRVCAAKGSSGPDCCGKKCVNVMTDKINCGKCGKKCQYSEICCQGECVNPSVDKKHCGRCNSKCKKGSSCVYGLCSYA